MRVRLCGLYRETRTVARAALLALAVGGLVVTVAKADGLLSSSPKDFNSYARPLVPEDFDHSYVVGLGEPDEVGIFVVDTVVNNTNPNLKNTDTFNDGETSIAVNPRHPNQIVITAFSGGWGTTAPLWLSNNGGNTWTNEFTINPPPELDPENETVG
jgi:hypothetical protein